MLNLDAPAVPVQPAPKLLGPHGGDLNHPGRHNEARRSDFKPISLSAVPGEPPGLHRFNRDHEDVARGGLQNEQPWHRIAAFMILHGYTNVEVAMAAKVSKDEVSILRAQRWFQQLLSQLANDTGEAVKGALESYAIESVEMVAGIMRSAESERVQLSAAQIILEQVRGRPTQYVKTESVKPKDPKDELEELERDLQSVRALQQTT